MCIMWCMSLRICVCCVVCVSAVSSETRRCACMHMCVCVFFSFRCCCQFLFPVNVHACVRAQDYMRIFNSIHWYSSMCHMEFKHRNHIFIYWMSTLILLCTSVCTNNGGGAAWCCLVVVDEKKISRLCTKRGESAFSMYFIAEAHAYQLQFPAMHVHTLSMYTRVYTSAHVFVRIACEIDAGTLPDMSKCYLLSPCLVVANRTYVFARESIQRISFVHVLHRLDDVVVCVASFAAFSWDAIAQTKCAFTYTHTCMQSAYMLVSVTAPHHFNSCRCDVMWSKAEAETISMQHWI